MGHMDQVAFVTFAIFVAGLIYDAGRKAQQIDALNRWRESLDPKIDGMIGTLAGVKALLERQRD